MDSYQNNFEPQSVTQEQKQDIFPWKYIFILFGSLGVVFFLSSSLVSIPTVQTNRLQLAADGVIMYSSLSDIEQSSLFEQFKSTFSRMYSTQDEETESLTNFKTFLRLVDDRNTAETANGGTGKHGITRFADISEEEFKKNFLGYDKNAKSEMNNKAISNVDYQGSDTHVNWAGVLTTPVRDQGYCGSCWAFSAVSQIESDAIRSGYLTVDDVLTVQKLVSCDKWSAGCGGGSTESAYYYIYKAGGLELDREYPYASYYDETGTCKSEDLGTNLVAVSDYYTLSSEEDMINHVLSTGPLSICVDASNWSSYTSGILSVCGTDVDHCVQVVGVDTEQNYWIIRNSWGTSWGVDGYIYIRAGENMCGITYDPTYVKVVNLQ